MRSEQDSTFRSEVVLVLLDVSVKGDQGRFVPGLRKENFSVFEDGQPQNITIFDPEDRPVTVGILLDESRSMTPKRQEVVAAARTLIEESNRMDEIFILHFNERVSAGLPNGVPFSNNTRELLVALAREVPGGKTALYDVLWEGLEHLRLGRRDKKALVLISDGGDTASRHNRRETAEMVERSPATIYPIGLYEEGDPDRDPGFLRWLAKTSGGEIYLPSGPEELAGVCRRVAREIRTRYTIGYIPAVHRRTGSLRRIRVRVRDPGQRKLTVHTRSGYRYDERDSLR
ncbi:MAG: VWA domain-containing protein [Bryobacteraceae bacterium]